MTNLRASQNHTNSLLAEGDNHTIYIYIYICIIATLWDSATRRLLCWAAINFIHRHKAPAPPPAVKPAGPLSADAYGRGSGQGDPNPQMKRLGCQATNNSWDAKYKFSPRSTSTYVCPECGGGKDHPFVG